MSLLYNESPILNNEQFQCVIQPGMYRCKVLKTYSKKHKGQTFPSYHVDVLPITIGIGLDPDDVSWKDIDVGSPLSTSATGAGFTSVPTTGSQCWVWHPGYNHTYPIETKPIIISFIPKQSMGSNPAIEEGGFSLGSGGLTDARMSIGSSNIEFKVDNQSYIEFNGKRQQYNLRTNEYNLQTPGSIEKSIFTTDLTNKKYRTHLSVYLSTPETKLSLPTTDVPHSDVMAGDQKINIKSALPGADYINKVIIQAGSLFDTTASPIKLKYGHIYQLETRQAVLAPNIPDTFTKLKLGQQSFIKDPMNDGVLYEWSGENLVDSFLVQIGTKISKEFYKLDLKSATTSFLESCSIVEGYKKEFILSPVNKYSLSFAAEGFSENVMIGASNFSHNLDPIGYTLSVNNNQGMITINNTSITIKIGNNFLNIGADGSINLTNGKSSMILSSASPIPIITNGSSPTKNVLTADFLEMFMNHTHMYAGMAGFTQPPIATIALQPPGIYPALPGTNVTFTQIS